MVETPHSPAAAAKRVSVVIPAFNAARTLDRAIASVLEQGPHVGEILLIDDGSTDATVSLAANYPGVRVLQQTHKGAATARNCGIRAAEHEFIAFLDADDQWAVDKLALQLAVFDRYSDVGFVATNYRFEKRDGAYDGFSRHDVVYAIPADVNGDIRIFRGSVFEALCSALFVATPTVVVRKAALDQVGLFDEELKISEDYDLWLRLSLQVGCAVITRPLVTVADTQGSLCSDQIETLLFTEKMFATFEQRVSGLTNTQLRHLRSRMAVVQRNLGYQYRMVGDRVSARKAYLHSFVTKAGWPAVFGWVKALLFRMPREAAIASSGSKTGDHD